MNEEDGLSKSEICHMKMIERNGSLHRRQKTETQIHLSEAAREENRLKHCTSQGSESEIFEDIRLEKNDSEDST